MSPARQELSAGAVVVRRGPGGRRVLVLHHAGYDEWRLPKGKLKLGESAARAAERELAEEAGVELPVREYLGAYAYRFGDDAEGGPVAKTVFFFAARAEEDQTVRLEPTFDRYEWLAPREAVARLSWPDEAEMVRRATATG